MKVASFQLSITNPFDLNWHIAARRYNQRMLPGDSAPKEEKNHRIILAMAAACRAGLSPCAMSPEALTDA